MDKKKYADFMDELSPSKLYEWLLVYGLFTDRLPPVFDAVPFYNYCEKEKPQILEKKSGYISFWTMRNIGVPRLMGIPNSIY